VQAPSGTVTLMFTDIEGSTRLAQQLGEGYAALLNDERQLLRAAVGEAGGYEVDCRADELFAVFARARDGVAAAVAAQRSLGARSWPEDVQLRVRAGLHTGEPALEDGIYLGVDVTRAARICSAGHGGQILLSQTTRDLVAGEADLKDLSKLINYHALIFPSFQNPLIRGASRQAVLIPTMCTASFLNSGKKSPPTYRANRPYGSKIRRRKSYSGTS